MPPPHRQAGHHELAERLVECQYELTDRLAFYLCGRKPGEQRAGQAWLGQGRWDPDTPQQQVPWRQSQLGNSVAKQLAPVKLLQALGFSTLG